MSGKDNREIKHVVLNLWKQLSLLPHTEVLRTSLGEFCLGIPLIEVKAKHEEFISVCVGTNDLWDLWTKTCVEFFTECGECDYESFVLDIFKHIKDIPSSISDDEYIILPGHTNREEDVDKMDVSFCLFTLLNVFLVFYKEEETNE